MDNNAIEAALADTKWGAWVKFLDTLNSVEELAELREYLKANHPDKQDPHLFESYEQWLTRWPNPELPVGFRESFPLVSAKLDTPQKIRIFLRGVEFRSYYRGVDANMMGCVFEEILRRHKVQGEKKIVYSQYRDCAFGDALRIVYHTQLQAWTLREIMLPEACSLGVSSNEGLYIDWRTKEERKAAGEYVY